MCNRDDVRLDISRLLPSSDERKDDHGIEAGGDGDSAGRCANLEHDDTGTEDEDMGDDASNVGVDPDNADDDEIEDEDDELRHEHPRLTAPPTTAPLETGTTIVDRAQVVPVLQKASEQTGDNVYDAQKQVAAALLKSMQAALVRPQDEHGSGGRGTLSETYESFDVTLCMPMINSLHAQTTLRLQRFLRARAEELLPDNEGLAAQYLALAEDPSQHVLKLGTAAASQAFRQLEQRAMHSPKTLFLVVHDEAHHSATRDQASFELVCSRRLRELPNVRVLFVSATPYNLLTANSQVPPQNEVLWDDALDEDGAYQGILQMQARSGTNETQAVATPTSDWLKPGIVTADPNFETKAKTLRAPQDVPLGADTTAAAKREWARLSALRDEYCQALTNVVESPDCREAPAGMTAAACMMRRLCNPREDGTGILVLVRSPSQIGKKGAKWLSSAIEQHRDAHEGLRGKFAVLVDVDVRKSGQFNDELDRQNPGFRVAMSIWRGKPKPQAQAKPYNVATYEDLADLPCILILCEKGKMGDTFPQSLRYYDLRMRCVRVLLRHYP